MAIQRRTFLSTFNGINPLEVGNAADNPIESVKVYSIIGQEMTTKSIPELLKRSLQSHMAEADLREDEELQDIMEKLSSLSDKVAAAKAQALARRARKAVDEA